MAYETFPIYVCIFNPASARFPKRVRALHNVRVHLVPQCGPSGAATVLMQDMFFRLYSDPCGSPLLWIRCLKRVREWASSFFTCLPHPPFGHPLLYD